MSRGYNFCNNCGESGHAFHQCRHPITSIGTVAFRLNEEGEREYLMICRKDSLGYVDFMRGKYPVHNVSYIRNIIDEMTIDEKRKIVNDSFDDLWNALWGQNVGIQYRGEERVSREKMATLREGIIDKSGSYDLEKLVSESKTTWRTPEWGFPKGRRNYQERELTCALREFQEETGYDTSLVKVIQNVVPFEEIFTGSNFKSYKHCYYVANMDTNVPEPSNFQATEVSSAKWLTFDEAIEHIRPYNVEKKDVLRRIDALLSQYRLCS